MTADCQLEIRQLGELEIAKVMDNYTGKTKTELARLTAENRLKLQNFRFAMAGSKTKNVKEGRNLRKEIARLLTELNKKLPNS